MQLGITAKDIITGFEGVILGHCRYITGCDQYLLQPPMKKDGTHVESRWFDEQRLVIVKNGKSIPDLNKGTKPGADKAAPRI